jgi:hypothetical protein
LARLHVSKWFRPSINVPSASSTMDGTVRSL